MDVCEELPDAPQAFGTARLRARAYFRRQDNDQFKSRGITYNTLGDWKPNFQYATVSNSNFQDNIVIS